MAATFWAFPGQGSQEPGMGRRLAAAHVVAADVFDEASASLDIDMRALMWDSPASVLTRTENAQPAIVTLGEAARRVWHATDVVSSPQWVTGHSVGALGAAIAAGALSFRDGVHLARRRGELMSSAPGEGAMLAVAVTSDDGRTTVLETARACDVDIACHNGSRQIVLSGQREHLERVRQVLGSRARFLDVSHGFHSRLMDPVLGAWELCLRDTPIGAPHIPLLSSVTGHLLHTVDDVLHDLLVGVRAPVRWDIVTALAEDSSLDAVVFGNGEAFARMWRRSPGGLVSTVVDDRSVRGGAHAA